MTCSPRSDNPLERATSYLAEYVGWLEREYDSPSISHPSHLLRDRWYIRRVFDLHQLISVLGLPVQEIAEKLRFLSQDLERSGLNPVDHEKHISHFLSSWAKYGPVAES